LEDFADGLADHHLAQLYRRHIRFDVVHPPPHVGIERQPFVSDKHLAVARLRDWRFDDSKIVLAGLDARTAGQQDLPVVCIHRAISMPRG
jgi:hypothetical protein